MSQKGFVVAIDDNLGRQGLTVVVVLDENLDAALVKAMDYVENVAFQSYKCTRIDSRRFRADPTAKSSLYAERENFSLYDIRVV